MNRSVPTSRGTVQIRAANPTDATRYRELRLEALLDSPTAFSADYQYFTKGEQIPKLTRKQGAGYARTLFSG